MAWHCGTQACPTHGRPSHACIGWSLAAISGSVGDAGRNAPADVRVIQGALNRVAGADTYDFLATDGSASPALGHAIGVFQKFALGMVHPDRRVSLAGPTYRALARRLRLKLIRVSLHRQELSAYEDGRRVYRFPCITGASDHPTEPGRFSVLRLERKYRSRTYDADMDYALFFSNDGKAIHQYHGYFGVARALKSVSDLFGSHGCVRLEESHARTLFNWAQQGTRVEIE